MASETKVLCHYIVTQPSGNKMFISTDDGIGWLVAAFPFSKIRKATNNEASAYLRKLDDQERQSKKLKKARR